MRARLWRKGPRLIPASYGFLSWLRNLQKWWRLALRTSRWSYREIHSLIKTPAHPEVANENWSFIYPSTHGGLKLPKGATKTRKMSWNDSGGVKFTSSIQTHHTISLVWINVINIVMGFPGALEDKASAHNAGDLGLIPGLPSLEEGIAIHSSILAWRISMDRGAWRATVHGVAKSQTGLSD